uniref:Tail protein n=1 Tax=viral metagenome TaxID=1070528 RepID=A0A6C0CLH7_9ZZZZ
MGIESATGTSDRLVKRHTSGVDISDTSVKIDTPGLYEIQIITNVDMSAEDSNALEWKLYENGVQTNVLHTAKTPATAHGTVVTFMHTTTQYNTKLEFYLKCSTGSPTVTLESRIINIKKVDLTTGCIADDHTGSISNKESGWLLIYDEDTVTMSGTAQNLFKDDPTAVVKYNTSNVTNPSVNNGITLNATGTYLFEFAGHQQSANATGSTYTIGLRENAVSIGQDYTLNDHLSGYNLMWIDTISTTGNVYNVYASSASSITGVNWLHRSLKVHRIDTTYNSTEWCMLRTRSSTAVTDISTAVNLFDLTGSQTETMDTATYTSGISATGGSRVIPINTSGLYRFEVGVHLDNGDSAETMDILLYEDGSLINGYSFSYQGSSIRHSFVHPVKVTSAAKEYELRVKTEGVTAATFYGRWVIVRQLDDHSTDFGTSSIDHLVMGNSLNIVAGQRSLILGPNNAKSMYKDLPDNTIIGADNIPLGTTGTSITHVGSTSLAALTTGGNHATFGYDVGDAIVVGDDHCYFGAGANCSADGTNRAAFGTNAICTADNSVQFGDTSVDTLTIGNGTATINTVSVSSAGIDGPVYFNGQLRQKYTSVTAAASNYDVVSTDNVILVDSSSATGTITLPAASSSIYRKITVKDKGNAGTNTIVIASDGSNDIEGSSTYSITGNYGTVTFVSDGSEWYRL